MAAAAAQEGDALEAAIAASGVRVFAFDFDMTLVNIHAYNSRVRAADVPKRWRNDGACWEIGGTVVNESHCLCRSHVLAASLA